MPKLCFDESKAMDQIRSLNTSNKSVVFSDPWAELQSAGEESTTIVSLYKFGTTWRPDVVSQASATGGKQRSLQSPSLSGKSKN